MLNLIITVGTESYNLIDDFGIYVKSYNIGNAEPKIYEIEVPYTDGVLDLTDKILDGKIKYKRRELVFPLRIATDQPLIDYSALCNAINGRIVKVTLAGDEDHYFEGRAICEKLSTNKSKYDGKITIKAHPYKKNVQLTRYNTTATAEGAVVSCLNEGREIKPSFNATGACVIRCNGGVKNVTEAGIYSWNDLTFKTGSTTVRISGNGVSVGIEYREEFL